MKVKTILDEIRPTLKHSCNVTMLEFLASFQDRRMVTRSIRMDEDESSRKRSGEDC